MVFRRRSANTGRELSKSHTRRSIRLMANLATVCVTSMLRILSRRRSTSAALVAVAAGVATLVAPTPAHAGLYGPDIACPTDPGIVWKVRAASRNVLVWEGVNYTINSASPTFAVSDGRVVDNTLTSPIDATFTSSVSNTFTVTVTLGTSAQLTEKLQSTVSVQIVQSRTTQIGINATVTVPPQSRVVGRYGVEVFNVAYTGQLVWQSYNAQRPGGFGGHCWERSNVAGSTVAPTVLEGWRFSTS
ncbi:hypothetical protein ACTMTJ_37420 [Phytohabitans sp. LJ34]|uniref:hypothetical protein n=1 Tax=Phytohabitans sp. LJ34 TaxID=3452217 RepID=UPI003F8A44A9